MLNLKDVTLFMYAGGPNSLEPTLKVFKHNQKLVDFGNSILIHNAQASFNDYQKFVIFELHKAIKTSHVLISHTDGFILNPEHWNRHWLEYDWIGAPWPLWWHLRGVRQGNGGFNLRSRRMMEFTSTFSDYNPDKIQAEDKNEDQFCMVKKRDKIIEAGMNLAPLDVAAKFSIEHAINEYPDRTHKDCFGFHGKFQLYQQELINGVLK